MSIKSKLKKNKIVFKIWNARNEKRLKKIDDRKVQGKHTFINRGKNSEKLCIILAGYKEFLWKDVFSRIKEYAPEDIDVCVVTSGMYNEKLASLCEKNDWSYLGVKENKVTLAQNIAINLHPNAKYIYKLDEDIFVTEGFFTQLKTTLDNIEKEGRYRPSFIAPLINVNGYSYIRLLEKMDLLNAFEKKFGKAVYDVNPTEPIVKNGEIAKFLWGSEETKIRNIDELSKNFANKDFEYSVCPIRFSIGAILMPREIWEKMHKFTVTDDVGLGLDEEELCKYAISESRPIIVSENVLVGHFSYGPQTEEMKKYYNENRDIFELRKDK
ncbi:MAG: hypothetical protein J6A89_09005 [Clostridia bacterium]|nr:hypothetical protein [Clostridia bacterium]